MSASPEGTHLEPPCDGAGGFCTKCGEYVVFAPAPLFTPEEIEDVRAAAEEVAVLRRPEWAARLRRIAEKMSAPSEKP